MTQAIRVLGSSRLTVLFKQELQAPEKQAAVACTAHFALKYCDLEGSREEPEDSTRFCLSPEPKGRLPRLL